MTHVDIRIEEIVLTGVPARMAEDLRPLVEQSLARRANQPDVAPSRRPHVLSTSQGLADAIADQVWTQAGLSATLANSTIGSANAGGER